MSLEAVYEIIEKAWESDQRTHRCDHWIADQLGSLHNSIELTQLDAVGSLRSFLADYIRLAPDTLAWINHCLDRNPAATFIRAFVETCEDFFLMPSARFLQLGGIRTLLINAYQCHRLLEECYDNNLSLLVEQQTGQAMTPANLLAHHLIGEPFANEVDQAVENHFRRLARPTDYRKLKLGEHLYGVCPDEENLLRENWQNLLQHHSIGFRFLRQA